MLASVSTASGRYSPSKAPFRKVQVTLIPNKSFNGLPDSIKQIVATLEQMFPEPENTADGARETIRNKFDRKELRPFAGGWEVSSNEVKISAAAVLALLAGVVTQDDLFKNLGFKPQSRKIGRFAIRFSIN